MYSKVMASQLSTDGYLYLLTHDNTLEVYQVLDKTLVIKKMKRKAQRMNSKEDKDTLDKDAFCKDVQNNIQFVKTHHLKDKVLSFRVTGSREKKEILISYDKTGVVVYSEEEDSLKEKSDLSSIVHQE